MLDKIIVVYDIKNWAFHHMARGLKRYSPRWCRVQIMGLEEYANYKPTNDVAAVLLLTRYGAEGRKARRMVTLFASHALRFSVCTEEDLRTRGVTKDRTFPRALDSLRRSDAVLVLNSELERTFRSNETGVPVQRIPQGIDDQTFTVKSRQTLKGPLRVGWCGQQTMGGPRDFKGYREMLQPLVNMNLPVEWSLNTRGPLDAWPPSRMAEWYRTLDAFVCTAFGEGGPLTVFEAAACGCHIISTPVGIVRDWADQAADQPGSCRPDLVEWRSPVGDDQIAGIVSQFADKIRRLDRAKIEGATAERAAYIAKHYSWRTLAPKWLDFAVRGIP